jgi:hypothetical protein
MRAGLAQVNPHENSMNAQIVAAGVSRLTFRDETRLEPADVNCYETDWLLARQLPANLVLLLT